MAATTPAAKKQRFEAESAEKSAKEKQVEVEDVCFGAGDIPTLKEWLKYKAMVQHYAEGGDMENSGGFSQVQGKAMKDVDEYVKNVVEHLAEKAKEKAGE